MDRMDIELQILQLSKLQQICNAIIDIENPKQDDKNLVKLLKKEYELSKDEVNSILAIVKDKKKSRKNAPKGDLDKLKEEFEMYCKLTKIHPYKANGEFIGYERVKNRSSNRKNVLKTKLQEMGE